MKYTVIWYRFPNGKETDEMISNSRDFYSFEKALAFLRGRVRLIKSTHWAGGSVVDYDNPWKWLYDIDNEGNEEDLRCEEVTPEVSATVEETEKSDDVPETEDTIPEQSNKTPETECEQLEDVPMSERSTFIYVYAEYCFRRGAVVLAELEVPENYTQADIDNVARNREILRYTFSKGQKWHFVDPESDDEPTPEHSNNSPVTEPEQPDSELDFEKKISTFEIPVCMQMKSLCGKCKHLESCFEEYHFRVFECIYQHKPCDDDIFGVYGECGECCTRCCTRFESFSENKTPLEIPFDMRIKSLCRKCNHLENCFDKDRSKVLEDVYHSEPCDDICGECTLCCPEFENVFGRWEVILNTEEIISDGDLPF